MRTSRRPMVTQPFVAYEGIAESQLEQQPFIVPYPSQKAKFGKCKNQSNKDDLYSAHANVSYELEITQDEMNLYAPFTASASVL